MKLLDLDVKANILNSKDIVREKVEKKDIAIIGICARMPKADDVGSFWKNIIDNKDCIGPFPERRREYAERYLKYVNPLRYKALGTKDYYDGAFLDEIDGFDYTLFNLSPKESELMDPNQRLFLEAAWGAIEDAGYGVERIKGTNTGVYAGYGVNEIFNYKRFIYDIEPSSIVNSMAGNVAPIIASRISYILDLKGPSMLIDTACSSSLVAVHLACQALKNGECDMAVAGAVKLYLAPLKFDAKAGIESSDGRARTFDDSSDGTGMGEGVAAVLLKPLHKAISDGDNIYAVIKGSAVNQDGNSIGITAPNAIAQEEMLIRAWKDAGIDPETITYIEAHGTGTSLGDPIEIDGLQRAFRRYTNRHQFCAIGSLKTNIGHLDTASGIAGFIKAVLTLKNEVIPASLHFEKPNHKINFESSPVYVNDKMTKWETNGFPRRCGVSAFGLSGTNCHVVLEEAPEIRHKAETCEYGLNILTLSAKSENALKNLVREYSDFLDRNYPNDLRDICFTTNTGRGSYSHRLALVFKDEYELKSKLNMIKSSGFLQILPEDVFYNEYSATEKNRNSIKENIPAGKDKRIQDEKAVERINAFIGEGRLNASILCDICKLYVNGADIDWKELYSGEQRRKASLPLYPFERKRCWLNIPDIEAADMDAAGDGMLYSLEWIRKDFDTVIDGSRKRTVLVLKNENGICDSIVEKLKDEADCVIEVIPGSGYEKDINGRYIVSGSQEDYRRLLSETEGRKLSMVVHLMTLDNEEEPESVEELDKRLDRGVTSVFRFTKALIDTGLRQELDFALVSQNVNRITGREGCYKPENSTLFGLGTVIGQEYPNIRCRCVDMDAASGIDAITKELVYAKGDFKAAYRDGERYVEELKEKRTEDIKDNKIEFKKDGAYIIAGGMGGIGLETGKYLASKNASNIALIGRSKMPPREDWEEIIRNRCDLPLCRRINAIKYMEDLGANVCCYSADVSKYEEISSVLDDIRKNSGGINGVICSAGIAGNGFLARKSEEVFKSVLAPKIFGSWLLDRLTEADSLDFFVMFSSQTSILGGAGQCDYTAANSYLDAFSAYRSSKGKRTLTVNWPAWRETGMAVDNGVNDMDGVFRPIDTQKAVELFDKLMQKEMHQIIIGKLNYEFISGMNEKLPFSLSKELMNKISLHKVVMGQKKNKSAGKPLKSVLLKGKDEGEQYTRAEKQVAGIWREVLGFEELNVNDNFFEIGGDSIQLHRLQALFDEQLPGKVKIVDLFSNQTISKQAHFILNSNGRMMDSPNSGTDDVFDEDIAMLLDEVSRGNCTVDNAYENTHEDMAIIGMAAKFPGSGSIPEYWENLKNGVDCISQFSEKRKKDADILLGDFNIKKDGISYTTGGYLEEIDGFDCAFFKISPRDANYMDPNQRVFLEVVNDAVEDAGYGGNKLRGSRTGVFVGFNSWPVYAQHIMQQDIKSFSFSSPGNLSSVISGRISYLMDFKGPAVLVDTACSSSLVALNLACKAIKSGDCGMAIVGGVKLSLTPVKIGDSIGIESSDGKTRTFDDNSDGTGWGEGAGAILIKPLKTAVRDGDNIYAVIKGSAVNQDGSSIGITAPNVDAQVDVITKAWEAAGVDPETITYMEAHGTGTRLGDPIEIEGIQKAFKKYSERKQFCAVSSVKTNIGHLDSVSGLAGLIKAVLALKHKEIPQMLHFAAPNRRIDFTQSPVYPADKPIKWEVEGTKRRCGISAFGLSGTNCHVVLEEAPKLEKNIDRAEAGLQVLTISAVSMASLKWLVSSYLDMLGKDRNICLADVCFTANTGRGRYEYRLALVTGSMEELIEKLGKVTCSGPGEIEQQGIFFNRFKVVSSDKLSRAGNEITNEEKRELEEDARVCIEEYLASIDEKKQLYKLCKLYTGGADVNWEDIYRGSKRYRVSLPSYAYDRKRCWLEPMADSSNRAVRDNVPDIYHHPLFDECLVKTMGQEIYLTRFSPEKHWVLKEHKIFDSYTVPGTTYIEMMAELFGKVYPERNMVIEDIRYISPLMVREYETGEVHTILRKNAESMDFVITSKQDSGDNKTDDNWIVHAEGKASVNGSKGISEFVLEEIKQRSRKIGKEIIFKNFTGAIEFGPRWRNINIKDLYEGDNEFLIQFELPDEFDSDLEKYFLHPSALDLAVTLGGVLTKKGLYLPLAYKNIKICGPVIKKFYSYIRVKEQQETNSETLSFSISLVDEAGRSFIDIESFIMKKVQDMDNKFKNTVPKKDIYHQINWVKEKPGDIEARAPETFLAFKDECGFGDEIIQNLRKRGCKVIEVEAGAGFEKRDSLSYMIGSTQEDYNKLIGEVKHEGISRILHLLTLGTKEGIETLDELEDGQCRGVYSLFYLSKSLLANKLGGKTEIVLISKTVNSVTGKEESLYPGSASLFGLGKVIGQEYPNLIVRCIDMDGNSSINDILKEINLIKAPYVVAYRNGERYIEEFAKADMVKIDSRTVEIKNGGVYVITGGAGGIGLEIAKFLASKNNVNIALINRTKMPEVSLWDEIIKDGSDKGLYRKIKGIKEIEELGAGVACYTADITKPKEVKNTFEDIRKRFGRINGVVHSAGIAGDGFIFNKDEMTFKKVLAPKIQGTWILDNVTAQDDLDFFIMFSSMSSIFGNPGQGDYTAANAFIDAFSAYRNHRGRRTLSINWPAWKDTGMAVNYGAAEDGGFKAIPTYLAIDAFGILVDKFISNICICEINFDKMLSLSQIDLPLRFSEEISTMLEKYRLNMAGMESRRGLSTEKHADVTMKGKPGGEYSKTEAMVANYWGEVLGLEEIDVYDSFSELGGESIMAARLLKKLERDFAGVVDIADIYTYPSINKLSEYIDKKMGNGPEVKSYVNDIDSLLDMLENGEISADEAQKMKV